MKKILLILFSIFILVSCNFSNTPSDKVAQYLNQFNNLSDNVLEDLETKSLNENLSETNRKSYINVLKRQYQDMKYEIKGESINGDKAIVTVKITVYDLYKSSNDSEYYMQQNISEFNDNGVFSEEKYLIYKLENMFKTTETVNYDVEFTLYKDSNGMWVLEDPNRTTLEKIHGFYDYVTYG